MGDRDLLHKDGNTGTADMSRHLSSSYGNSARKRAAPKRLEMKGLQNIT